MENEVPSEAVAVSPTDKTSDREQSDSDQVLNAESFALLARSASDVAGGLERLRRNRTVDRIIITSMGVVLTAVFIMLIILSIGEYQAAKQRKLIISCTTPGGECYEDSARRTAGAVKSIGEASAAASAAAAACAEAHDGYRAIKACVDRTLR